ncbi:hypothetical protein [Deinococcus marmoris]|uniref:Uncharacterized protein n=1 Tax=Deinococcus marmoris TaxID=249408 RepID=A0A1U7NZY0_9DEIO|nr:hypothetical protein [Deinococcus marmoris]OLV18460.1 hypothetical protein BOO71_0005521 [Deinococcus marmoris]
MLLAGILLTGAAAQTSTGKTELVRSSLDAGVTQLVARINDAVTASGGDLERQRADWVVAFSTGHYKSDPLGAQAAREVATQLIQRRAVSGDKVTARAWEMNVWEYRNPQGLTVQIGTDSAGDKSRIENLWPTTPAVGSIGGHDTEQAAVTLTQELSGDSSAVLILLTNTAASVGTAGTRLLGTNAPEYQNMLSSWNRVEGSQDGATLNLPYVVSTPSGEVQGQMQAVVFIPKTFTASPLAGGTRTEQLAAPAASTPAQRSGGGGTAIFIILGLLALGAAAYFLLFRGKGGSGGGGGRGTLRVGDSDFSLSGLPRNKPFCIIAGPGYASESEVAVIPVQGLPAAPIAELTRVGKDIRVRAVHEDIRLSSVGGKVTVGDSATVPLRQDQPDTVLDFSGEVRGAGGVPREVSRSVTLSYSQ